nr:hypothetical protein Iba_chr15aCG8290 [Ipomoea batatas]
MPPSRRPPVARQHASRCRRPVASPTSAASARLCSASIFFSGLRR